MMANLSLYISTLQEVFFFNDYNTVVMPLMKSSI